jgi:beta-lactamase regulating signal transducer with metallopeptidase domain
VTALLAALWQGVAAAWTTAFVLESRPRTPAAVRHGVWWAVMAIVLALPLWSLVAGAAPTASAVGPAVPPTLTGRGVVLLEPPDWLVAGAVLAWMGWVCLGAVRLGLGLAALGRLRRAAMPIEETLQRQLPMWDASRHSGRQPLLCWSSDVSTACVVGLVGRPVILVSPRVMAALDARDLDRLVMHEQAHLARYDDWTRLVQRVIAVVAGFHPAVAFIGRRIDFEREASCDDRVVALGGHPLRYARVLADAADLSLPPRGATLTERLAPGASDGLAARVARLVDHERVAHRPLRRLGAALGAATLACAAWVAGTQAPHVIVNRPGESWPSIGRASLATPQGLSARAVIARPDAVGATVQPDIHDGRPRSSAPAPRVAAAAAASDVDHSRGPSPVTSPAVVDPAPAGLERPLLSAAAGPPALVDPVHLPSRVFRAGTAAAIEVAARPASPPPGGPTWRDAVDSGARVGRSLARAGVAAGSSTRSAGLAVAGFFTRAGKGVAELSSP